MSDLGLGYQMTSFPTGLLIQMGTHHYYAFGLIHVVYCEGPGVQPKSDYTGRIQSEDHCSTQECYKGHVIVCVTGGGLQVGCMQG